jgi:hypothetical protein
MLPLPNQRFTLEHDPKKWIPVFGKRSCLDKNLERDTDSTENHRALGHRFIHIQTEMNIAAEPAKCSPIAMKPRFGSMSIPATRRRLKLCRNIPRSKNRFPLCADLL